MTGISPQYDSMIAIETMINGLSLSGNPGVLLQEVPAYWLDTPELEKPYISISPVGQETSGDWTDVDDQIGFPVTIAIVSDPGLGTLERRLGWRFEIIRRLRNRDLGLTGDYFSFNVHPEPGPIVDATAWIKSKLSVSIVTARIDAIVHRN